MSNASPNFVKAKVERGGDFVIMTLLGAADRTEMNMIAKELAGFPGFAGPHHLLLNFTNLTYINSDELGTLIGLHKKMKAAGGCLTLFNVSELIKEVFEITRLDGLLNICRQETPETGDERSCPK